MHLLKIGVQQVAGRQKKGCATLTRSLVYQEVITNIYLLECTLVQVLGNSINLVKSHGYVMIMAGRLLESENIFQVKMLGD